MAGLRIPKVTGVADKFPREVSADQRRITGVTPSMTKGFAEQPWRYLKKASGIKSLAGGGGKRGSGGL